MTEELIATKANPAPLDGFETAKPDEPIFTLQGGDPLGAPVVRIWAWLARVRAGVVSVSVVKQLLEETETAVLENSVSDDEREQDNLKLRATAAEEVSWAMDAYRKGEHQAPVDKPTQAADTHLDELARIDLHDIRVRSAQRLSSFQAEALEIHEALAKRGYDDDVVLGRLTAVAQALRVLNDAIEPRRIFREAR